MKTKSVTKILAGHLEMINVIIEVENELGVTLMARNPNDTLHGYISMIHHYDKDNNPISTVEVHLYEENEDPRKGVSSIDAILHSATDGLSSTKKKLVMDKLIPVLGGHTTKLKRPGYLDSKHKKLKDWSNVDINNKMKEE